MTMAATLTESFHGDDVTLSTSPTLIYTADGDLAMIDPSEQILVQNLDASIIVTVGGSDVADKSNGFVLSSQYSYITIPLRMGTEVYAIAASGTPLVSVTRV